MITKNKKEGIKTMKIKNLKLIVATSVILVSSLFAKELASTSVSSRATQRECSMVKIKSWHFCT